jgi:hypothetical protein
MSEELNKAFRAIEKLELKPVIQQPPAEAKQKYRMELIEGNSFRILSDTYPDAKLTGAHALAQTILDALNKTKELEARVKELETQVEEMSTWPGSPLYPCYPYDLEEHRRQYGNGTNAMRSEHCAQPGTLQVGDELITGDRVLSPPREGGNGSVLVHLTGGTEGHWISLPSRIPVALKSIQSSHNEAVKAVENLIKQIEERRTRLTPEGTSANFAYEWCGKHLRALLDTKTKDQE